MHNLIVILGPTASGKTKLATHLAHKLNTGVISADSRQVYKGMDIGTGKDLNEYYIENQSIKHHLIDIINAGEKYNVADFQNDFQRIFNEYVAENKTSILCGGTGLYIQSVLTENQFTQVPIDEKLRENLLQIPHSELVNQFKAIAHFYPNADTSTHKRTIRAIEIAQYIQQNPQFLQNLPKLHLPKPILFGLNPEREIRRTRIENRLNERLQNNALINEVETLIKLGVEIDTLKYYGLEYKFVCEFLENKYSFEEMHLHLQIAIQQYAKRQMTWFRKMEKDGFEINWLPNNLDIYEQVKWVEEKLKNSKCL